MSIPQPQTRQMVHEGDAPEISDADTIQLDLVEVIELSVGGRQIRAYHKRDRALDISGLTECPSIRFRADGDRIVAVGLQEYVDGRSDHTVTSRRSEPEGRIKLPEGIVSDALGASKAALEDAPMRLAVYAARDEQVIVYAQPTSLEIRRADVEDLRE